MSESIIADFTTRLIPDAARYTEPVRGRVLLSEQRIVLATGRERTTIPVRHVFDVAYDRTPDGLEDFFDDTVTIGYKNGQTQQLAVIEGDDNTLSRFADLLFKAILNDTDAVIANSAGEEDDPDPTRVTLGLGDNKIILAGATTLVIDVATVLGYERGTWLASDDEYPALSIHRAVAGGEPICTRIALAANRKLNVLGRYLQLSRIQFEESLAERSVTDEERDALTSLYTEPNANLARTLAADASHATMIQRRLVEKDLLESDGTTLTGIGRFTAVNG